MPPEKILMHEFELYWTEASVSFFLCYSHSGYVLGETLEADAFVDRKIENYNE